jgi:DNA-binding NtrC family response regulator
VTELSTSPDDRAIVGTSAAMREVHRVIEGVASTDATILVRGESGTGKQLVARAIHARSRRADKPLVTLDCAAIPKELVETELFRLFAATNGGTIFLEEVGHLSPSVQVKLLRTLQSGEVRRPDSDAVDRVDVRVITATTTDLEGAINAGTFRRDLAERLGAVTVRLPTLRERAEDVVLLANHFIQKHAPIAKRTASRLDHDAEQCLLRHPWPGNVRELERAIEQAVVRSEGDSITKHDLPTEVRADDSEPPLSLPFGTAPHGPAPSSVSELVESLGLSQMAYAEAKKRMLADFNDAYVAALLRIANGNMSEAARRSGLDRSNFRRLVRSTSVDPGPASRRGSNE